jgi:hypothetical protein
MNTPPTTPSTMEAGALARELAKARNKLIAYYKHQFDQSTPGAGGNAEMLPTTANVERIQQTPADRSSWLDIEQLAAVDPALAARRWEEIKAEAFAELASGHRAAKPLETADHSCWERAQFLALRDDLASQWRPRTGIEWALIDTMVQALTLQTFWMHRMVIVDVIEWPEPPSKEMAKWQPPRLSSSMAIDQAAGMVDRFNRIFMRALRQLRDLRRYTVVIQSAEQVNIGQQQLNVTNSPKDPQ